MNTCVIKDTNREVSAIWIAHEFNYVIKRDANYNILSAKSSVAE